MFLYLQQGEELQPLSLCTLDSVTLGPIGTVEKDIHLSIWDFGGKSIVTVPHHYRKEGFTMLYFLAKDLSITHEFHANL